MPSYYQVSRYTLHRCREQVGLYVYERSVIYNERRPRGFNASSSALSITPILHHRAPSVKLRAVREMRGLFCFHLGILPRKHGIGCSVRSTPPAVDIIRLESCMRASDSGYTHFVVQFTTAMINTLETACTEASWTVLRLRRVWAITCDHQYARKGCIGERKYAAGDQLMKSMTVRSWECLPPFHLHFHLHSYPRRLCVFVRCHDCDGFHRLTTASALVHPDTWNTWP